MSEGWGGGRGVCLEGEGDGGVTPGEGACLSLLLRENYELSRKRLASSSQNVISGCLKRDDECKLLDRTLQQEQANITSHAML